jgi:hypothetical protein
VKRRLVDLVAAAALVSVVFVALLAIQPFSRQTALHLYLLALAALALASTVAALPPRGRSAFDATLRRPPSQTQRPPQLERVERTVTLGVANAFDFHARLRPLLRDVATARLGARGIELDSPRGRATVGEPAWELLRPDRPPPDDRFAGGVEANELRRLVGFLENL